MSTNLERDDSVFRAQLVLTEGRLPLAPPDCAPCRCVPNRRAVS